MTEMKNVRYLNRRSPASSPGTRREFLERVEVLDSELHDFFSSSSRAPRSSTERLGFTKAPHPNNHPKSSKLLPKTARRRRSLRRWMASSRSADPSRRTRAARLDLSIHVRVLFRYLERVDPDTLDLAKAVLRDCERKHSAGDSEYPSLAEAIAARLRDAVGERHWTAARKIRCQVETNQRRRRLEEEVMEMEE